MIRWFAINSIASNLLMGILIVVGAWCYFEKVQPEVQPTVQFEEVQTSSSPNRKPVITDACRCSKRPSSCSTRGRAP